jgi:hypothetical protein
MTPRRTIVFFPCHSFADFPTWLGDSEADELLAAWTAAWHPRLVAASGRMPSWASVEAPPGNDVEILGIVTAHCDDRLVGLVDPASTPGSRWVRRAGDRDATVRGALAALGLDDVAPPTTPDAPGNRPVAAADFHAFGLAWLLSELLAKRMRSSTGLGSGPFAGTSADAAMEGFEARFVEGARAYVAGDGAGAAEALRECYGHLEAARARYYPVDVWLVDIILLAETTLGRRLAAELDGATAAALVSSGELVERLAATDAALAARLREACEAGRIAPAGGRYREDPLDNALPETIRESFLQGHHAWRKALGRVPATFAQCGGGWSAILPQVLAQFGYSGAIWNLFDGTSLPDPGTGRIRWEGSGGATIDGIARPPLDARRASVILGLADRIGDALDHDHTAVVSFAHHAGLTSPFFDDLRRIGAWSSALGTFVTPDELFRRTGGEGTLVNWEPDAYPVSRPPEGDGTATIGDPIAPRVAAARGEATRITAGRKVLAGLAQAPAPSPAPSGPAADRPPVARGRPAATGGLLAGLARGIFGSGGNDRLVLEHDRLRVRVSPATGGILSLRPPGERGNRLSQHVAVRSTRAAPPPGAPWEDALDRAEHVPAVAERVERVGDLAVESRAALADHAGRRVGRVTQRVELVPGEAMVRLALDVALDAPPAAGTGPILEHYLACRFAWNENDDMEVLRGLHGQAVSSERTLLTAPHFLCLRPWRGDAPEVVLLTGGLPWHLRATPHTLDSLLLAGDGTGGTFTLAIGVGTRRPAAAALALLAGAPVTAAEPPPSTDARNVRLTWQGPVLEGGRPVGVRAGLLETEGRGGDVTVDWGFDIAAAHVADALGRPVEGRQVTVAGRSTTAFLRRYEWLCLDLLFPGPGGRRQSTAEAVPAGDPRG